MSYTGLAPKFWSGICEGCRKPYVRRSCKAPKFCNDKCGRRFWARRRRQRGGRPYTTQKAEYADRMAEIQGRIASGELTLLPDNVCPRCSWMDGVERKIATGTDGWTGRTWEQCVCGFRWLGRWKAA